MLDLRLEALAQARRGIMVMLGRDPLSVHEVESYRQPTIEGTLSSLVRNLEFSAEIEAPFTLTGYASPGRFVGEPSARLTNWAAEHLPLTAHSKKAVADAEHWRALLQAIWGDERFVQTVKTAGMPRSSVGGLIRGLHAVDRPDVSAPAIYAGEVPQKIEGYASLLVVGREAVDPPSNRATPLLRSIKSLSRIHQRHGVFVATDVDPQMMISPLAAGRYNLRMHIRYERPNDNVDGEYAQLYFDFGTGFKEEHSFKFTIRKGVLSLNALLALDSSAKNLRFDPITIPARFSVQYFCAEKMT